MYRTEVRDDIFLFPYVEENEPEGTTIDGFFANIPPPTSLSAGAPGASPKSG